MKKDTQKVLLFGLCVSQFQMSVNLSMALKENGKILNPVSWTVTSFACVE